MARGLRSNKGKALRRLRRERLDQMEKAAAIKKAAATDGPAEAARDKPQESAPQLQTETAEAGAVVPPADSSQAPAQASPEAEAMETDEQEPRVEQQRLGVSKTSIKGKKQVIVLNRPLHKQRKKGKKVPRAWFHGD